MNKKDQSDAFNRLDGVTTFAFYRGSAWVVESQSGHFWDPANAGPDAEPPFQIVEVSL